MNLHKSMSFTTSLSSLKYSSKPQPKELGKITKSFKATELTVFDLSRYITSGQAFTPCVFKDNKRTNKNFESTQVFALDFDDNQDIDQTIKKFTDLGFTVNLVYTSFSHKPTYNKFRLVIVFDTVITDRKLRDKIQLALMDIAEDSDAACKDAARLFFGTNAAPYLMNTELNSYDDLVIVLDSYINANVSRPTNIKNTKSLKKFTNTLTLNNIIKDEPICKENEDLIQHYNFEEACKTSKTLGFFANGGHLKYRQLFVLASNMQYIKGGLKWVKDIMLKAGTYKKEDFQLLSSVVKYNYAPAKIDDFDAELIGEYKNLLHIDKIRQGVHILEPIEKVDVKILRERFGVEMNRVYNRDILNNFATEDNIKLINIINGGVAIGKSSFIIRLENVLIALPSHKLKRELSEKMQAEKIPHITTPQVPVFNDENINSKYKFYQEIGDGYKANQLIKSISQRVHITSVNYGTDAEIEDTQKAKEYLRRLEECYNSDITVLTTHRRAILSHDKFKKNHIIFDEDIFKELMPISDFKRNDLDNLIVQIQKSTTNQREARQFEQDIKNIYNYLESLPTAIIRPTEKVVFHNEKNFINKISALKGGEKLIQFLNSEYILKHVDLNSVEKFYSIKKVSLPKDKQITIVSATADDWIYKKLLKNVDYEFTNIGVAKNQKNIVQHTGTAYSKNQLSKGKKPQVKEDFKVITYLNYKSDFTNGEEIVHFGNSTGYDHLKGENIVVVGTPIPPPAVTTLYAKLLGLSYDNQQKSNRYCKLGNYIFDMYTYEDDNLAQIETRLAQMELEQAAGRGRTAVTGSEVVIYAKVPINSADDFNI